MSDKPKKKTEEIVKLWMGEDRLLHIYLGGKLGLTGVKKFVEDKIKLLREVKGKTRVFCDLRDVVGSDITLAVKARRLIIGELKKLEKEKVEKMAMVGSSSTLKMIGFFVSGALGIQAQYFTDEQKALKWLKE